MGIDISSTMVGLTEQRLAPFRGRSTVSLTDGSLTFDHPDGSFDRFVANYMLDLLPTGDIARVVSEARRLLKDDGLICLVSLSQGRSPLKDLGLISFFHNLLFLGRFSLVNDANIHTPAAPWAPFVMLVPVVGAVGVAFLV